MDQTTMRRYAELLVESCLGVKSGSRLRIAGETCHRGLMLEIAARAYALGAREVKLDYSDPRLTRIRAENSREEWLDDASLLLQREAEAYREGEWYSLSLMGEDDPAALEGADPARMQRLSQARMEAMKVFREAMMANALPWCVAPVPTAAWGRSVLSQAGRDPGSDPEAALWQALVPILRLDAPDPAAAVMAHGKLLSARAKALNGLALDSLHFTGPGTDLTVGLSARSRWIGGGSRTPDGHFFLPNHPTEEVFASPDARRTEGHVSCTRPLQVLGAKVEGAWFDFEGGAVRRFGAAKNEASLGRYLDADSGTRRLGEVALVDATGPIFRSGLVFDNALIDENAACHIALGAAYEEAFEGSEGTDDAWKASEGFNVSMCHEDFMIGSEAVSVVGHTASGAEVPILKDGAFAIREAT